MWRDCNEWLVNSKQQQLFTIFISLLDSTTLSIWIHFNPHLRTFKYKVLLCQPNLLLTVCYIFVVCQTTSSTFREISNFCFHFVSSFHTTTRSTLSLQSTVASWLCRSLAFSVLHSTNMPGVQNPTWMIMIVISSICILAYFQYSCSLLKFYSCSSIPCKLCFPIRVPPWTSSRSGLQNLKVFTYFITADIGL